MESSPNVEDAEEVDNGFISYITNSIKFLDTDTNTIVGNLTLATVLQFFVMEIFGVKFKEESAASLNSFEACSAIQKLTCDLCIVHYQGKYIIDLCI